MRISDWSSDVCTSDLQFIDQRRRAGRWRNVLAMLGGEPGAAPSAEETFVARSSLEAFDALAVDHRAVLLLVVVEGLPYQEAAHALDVPVGTVMSRLSRARAEYRRLTGRSEEHTSELQSLMRISYAVFC